MVPAAIALIIGYVVPTGWTISKSFQDWAPVPGAEGEFVGLDNYAAVAEHSTRAIGFALVTILVPLLALLAVAPLLAWLAHRAGIAGRRAVRLALVLPLVVFAPAGAALGWRADRFDPESGRIDLLTAVWLSTFGLVCAIGVILFLAALRPAQTTPTGPAPVGPGQPPPATPGPSGRLSSGYVTDGPAPVVRPRSAWPAVLTVAALTTITVLAVGLQGFTYPLLMGETDSAMAALFRHSFQTLAGGPAAAYASLLLVPLMVLGVGAWLLVVLTGLRIEMDPARPGPAPARRGRAGALVATCLGALVVLAVAGYGLWPLLSRLGDTGPQATPGAGEVLVNTWVPTLISTVIGVLLAAVAAFGIGWLRPLGRWSELLLLPFAPWLFVAVGPLVLAKFSSAADAGRFDTFTALIPPVWLAIPALFVLTLLFRGLARQRPEPAATEGSGRAVARALPMVALLAGATWLVQAESLLWPLVGGSREMTAVTLAYRTEAQFGTSDLGFGLLLPIPLILVLAVALGLLHLLYLDRLAIRVGQEPRSRSPR